MKRQNLYPANICTAFDQHPFGMLMPERSYSSGDYRYGFNSQEKDDEVAGSGNINTAEFWEYDCRLGRRWNMDPVMCVTLSHYVAFANNPLFFVDHKGNKFTRPKDEDAANELKSKCKKQELIYNSLAEHKNKLMKIAYKFHLYNWGDKISRQRDKYKKAASDMRDAQQEIAEIINSGQKFQIEFSTASKSRTNGDLYIIALPIESDDGIMAHEFKHASDYLHGKLGKSNNGLFLYNDIYDEQLAYVRQFYVSPSSMPNSETGPNLTENDNSTANTSKITCDWVRGVKKNGAFLYGPNVFPFRYDATGVNSKENRAYWEAVIRPYLQEHSPEVLKYYKSGEDGKIIKMTVE